jgi:hypothetical protein
MNKEIERYKEQAANIELSLNRAIATIETLKTVENQQLAVEAVEKFNSSQT